MRYVVSILVLSGMLTSVESVQASFVFITESDATQTISSPLFGPQPVQISAFGTQVFTIDTVAGTANVTSNLSGADLPDPLNPGGFLTYDLANTVTTGTVTTNLDGSFDVAFLLLFELAITNGPLAGITFETLQPAIFVASDIPTLPFPVGTVFSDPQFAAPDLRPIFLKDDPNGILATLPTPISPGDPVGASFNRTVTTLANVPEPSSGILMLIAGAGLGMFWRSKRKSETN